MRTLILLTFYLSITSSFGSEYDLEIYCQDLNVVLLRMDIHNMNIANKSTTRTKEGGPYKKRIVKSCKEGACVVVESSSPPIFIYDPSHPDAKINGYVAHPVFSVTKEMSGLIKAQRAYEVIMENKPFESLDQILGNKLDNCFKKYSFFKEHFELKSYLGR